MKRRHLLLLPAALAAFWAVGAAAAAEQYHSTYSVSVLGLKVASSSFRTTVDGDTVTIDGSLRSSGLARLFDDTRGNTSVTAKLRKSGVEPRDYDLRYVSGRQKKRTTIRFRNGVAKASNTPPLRKYANYVALKPSDLRGVWDPMTALILHADSPAKVCERTVRIFDGEIRVDLKLTHAGRVPFSTQGFKGDAVRCKVSFIPVAGYRPNKQQIRYLATRSRMEVVLAPFGDRNLYAPVRARVGTKIGPVTVYATRFAAQ